MSSSTLASEQLGLIRRTFFADAIDSEFFKQRDLLLQAIAFPAAHLKERYGVSTPDSISRAILCTVIETIKAHGNRKKIERLNVYFLHCVQSHLQHHGEEYYEKAKAARRAAESLPAVISQVRIGETERSTDLLVALHRTLKSKGGRKKVAPKTQMELI
jgi:hypothetical protein